MTRLVYCDSFTKQPQRFTWRNGTKGLLYLCLFGSLVASTLFSW